MPYIEWIRFILAALFALLALVIPGYIAARGVFRSRTTTVCVSSCLSVALYVLSGILLYISGVRANGAVQFGATAFLAVLISAFRSVFRSRRTSESASAPGKAACLSPRVAGLYVLAGVIIVFLYYVMCLDGPSSYANASDTCAHLNFVRAFIESGTFNTLKVSSSAASVPMGSFYPAAWHVLAAATTAFTGGSITMASNVVNILIIAFIFPSSCALILSRVFSASSIEMRVGSFVCVCFVGFPWVFLVWGQLLSNLLGFALVPIFVFLFDELLFLREASERRQVACLLVLAMIALVFSQPNAVFTAGVFCIPSIIRRVQLSCDLKQLNVTLKRAAPVTTLVGIAIVWVLVYKLPIMEGVVSFDWRPSNNVVQSVANALCLAYGSLQTAQPLLAGFVLLGLIRLMADRSRRFLCAIYLFCFLVYVANTTIGFPHSHVLSGFWYNDPYRTGAMLAMVSIPLACSGVAAVISLVKTFVCSCESWNDTKLAQAVMVAVLALLILFPTYELPGYGIRRTGFGSFSELMTSLYSHDNAGGIDNEEWLFLDEVKSVVGNDLVLNIPEDGSGSLYGTLGMNIQFRRFPVDTQDPTVAVLGKRLSELSTDSEVRCKVRAMGLRYVMMLDCHANLGEGSLVAYANQPDTWSGVYAIKDDTPGFELLLSEGDMRLYRINDEALE